MALGTACRLARAHLPCVCCDSLLSHLCTTVPSVTQVSVLHWQESWAVKDCVSKLQKLGFLSKFLSSEHTEEWNTAQLTWRRQWRTAALLPGTGKTFLGNIFCLLMSPQQKALDLSQLPESFHFQVLIIFLCFLLSLFLGCVCWKRFSPFLQLPSSC